MSQPTQPGQDVPDELRAIARQAFAGRPADAEGALSLDSARNPWVALDDALAAVLPAIRKDERTKVAEEIAQALLAPMTMTNREMTEIGKIVDDEYHEECGPPYMAYAARIARCSARGTS
jgi:hypothetical protein